MIFSNHTSYVDLLYFAMKFAPQYSEFLADSRNEKSKEEMTFIIRPITLFRAFLNVSKGITTRIPTNYSRTITDRNLNEVLDRCSRYNSGPLLVFPEVMYSNLIENQGKIETILMNCFIKDRVVIDSFNIIYMINIDDDTVSM